jgi:hypothetical protein
VAALVGALIGCDEPYYQAYSYIYKSDYYYPSGHAR